MLLPAFAKAKDQGKYARWLGHKRNIEADTDAVAVYTFQDEVGDTLANSAVGLEGETSYHAKRYDGDLNNAIWTQGRWRSKGALDFNGFSSSVDVGNWDVHSQGDDGITIAAWFRADDFDITDARILSKADSSSSSRHWFMLSTRGDSGEDRLRFRLKADGTTNEVLAGQGALQTDEWVFAVCTYDGKMMRLYKDGEEIDATPITGKVSTDSSINVHIGANPVGGKWFDGLIDEVAVWRRSLSATEIRDQYTMGRP
jgi:hypothetical protein